MIQFLEKKTVQGQTYRLLVWLKPVLVILGTGTTMSALALNAIFQGLLIPYGRGGLLPEVRANPIALWIFYIGSFAACILAAIVLQDASHAIAGFFPAYGIAGVITYVVLNIPGITGSYAFPTALQQSGLTFTLTAFFPILLFVGLVGTIIGVGLAERIS